MIIIFSCWTSIYFTLILKVHYVTLGPLAVKKNLHVFRERTLFWLCFGSDSADEYGYPERDLKLSTVVYPLIDMLLS